MAFSSRIGSLCRQSISNNLAPTSQAPMMSMLNAVRYMSSSKLFIGGLSYQVGDESLRDAFSGFGEVTEARVIMDRDSGRSRGFGFVSFGDEESATSALSSMDGKELEGRNIRVSYATDRSSAPRGGGGYGGGGGGYGGGGGGYGGGGYGGGGGGY